MYQPEVDEKIKLCAPCSQARANSSLAILDYPDGENASRVSSEPSVALAMRPMDDV